MEIRQTEDTRDVDRIDMHLRSVESISRAASHTVSTGAKYAASGAKHIGRYTANTAKYMSLEKEGRQAVKYLSREQLKQWNSYTRHEQEQILKTVSAKVERRMRFQPADTVRAGPNDSKPDWTKIAGNYRRQETTRTVRTGNGRSGYHAGNAFTGSAAVRQSVYVNPYISRSTLKNIRQNRAQKEFRKWTDDYSRIRKDSVRGNRNTPRMKEDSIRGHRNSPRIKDESACGDQRGQRVNEITGLRKMYIIRRERGADNKGIRLKNELDSLAAGPDGHRHTIHTISRDAKGRRRETTETFYTPDRGKASYRFQKEKRKIRKAQKKETAAKNAMFRRELAGMIDRDMRKQGALNRMQRMEAAEMAQLEKETASTAFSAVTMPLRFRAARAMAELKQKLAQAAAGIMKYVAMVGGVLFLIIFLVAFFAALFGALAGSEQEYQESYSASGSEIVEYAQSWIGITQYVYGAGRSSDTDWQDYSDCSSFVHGVFNNFGISVGWDTDAMESDGTLIGTSTLEDAVAGDIILFYSGTVASGNSYHVGIYAGNGEMVHNSTSRGVCQTSVTYSGSIYEVRRVLSGLTTGNSTDETIYTTEQLETIYAIVCQEDGGSYAGALAVISTAMNRVDSARWASYGSNAYEQLTAAGQFCYSIDSKWEKYLGGNVPDYVKQAVSDCLDNGIRNHTYTSFRSYYTEGSVRIGGGNWYFS
ncbi:MAG: NlpC/P60 family protein [Clostridiales bacterium]|nr:NlpC/P60 family protein [Clostridiales bacterium]